MAIEIRPEVKNYQFSHIFFEHGYLTYYNSYMLDAKTHLEGGMSQNLDLGFSYCFIV